MRVYSLSIHADYACGHSGACCSSGWPIPVERPALEALSSQVASGRIIVPAAAGDGPHGVRREESDDFRSDPPGGNLFASTEDAPAETPVVAAVRPDGVCAFYERHSGLCAIHRQAGTALLPVACQQFPRVSLLDGRGLLVNVSHYCPTAASLLFRDDVDLEIVEGPPAFPADFEYDPLDARDALPPLLRPGVLLDLETFDRWEHEVVAVFGREGLSAEDALGTVAGFTEALREWTPARGDLAAHFDKALERPGPRPEVQGPRSSSINLVLAAIPDALRPTLSFDRLEAAYAARVEPAWPAFATAVRRYLAAKAFGSWLGYQACGLRTIVFSLAVALSALKANAALECARRDSGLDREGLTAAVRRTDEMLLHLAAREALAGALGGVEATGARASQG